MLLSDAASLLRRFIARSEGALEVKGRAAIEAETITGFIQLTDFQEVGIYRGAKDLAPPWRRRNIFARILILLQISA